MTMIPSLSVRLTIIINPISTVLAKLNDDISSCYYGWFQKININYSENNIM